MVMGGLILSSLIEYWGGEALPKCRKVCHRRCFHTNHRLAPNMAAPRGCLGCLGCWSLECASTSSSSPQLSRRASSCQSEAVLQHKKGALELLKKEARGSLSNSRPTAPYIARTREWYDPEEYYYQCCLLYYVLDCIITIISSSETGNAAWKKQ